MTAQPSSPSRARYIVPLLAALFSLLPTIAAAQPQPQPAAPADRPNVLFLAVDDLRPDLGCYGHPDAITPHIDALADRGVRFDRAYVAVAVCCPSRTAMMTGLRPDTTRVWRNTHFRDHLPDTVTLTQHFMRHGYFVQGIGKIFHDAFDPAIHPSSRIGHDDPSWSLPFYCPGPRYYYTPEGIQIARRNYNRRIDDREPGLDEWHTRWVTGLAMEAPDVPDSILYDGEVADQAILALRQMAHKDGPWFLAAGFLRPHLPFVAPKRYWDLYDPAALSMPASTEPPAGVPAIALHNFGELRYYHETPARGPVSAEQTRELRHGYLACVSFIDAQVGRILAELDALGLADDTIVVLWGDHGWHLGEHGLWAKTTNFELDTRAPLIVAAPGLAGNGQATESLAEFVDVYPTLAELAGLPLREELEGVSLVPVLRDVDASVNGAAYSQFPRGGNVHRGGEVMGYSMRTDRWRYTEWVRRSDDVIIAQELYDHDADAGETVNIAAQAAHADTIAALAATMREDLKYDAKTQDETGAEDGTLVATGFEDVPAGGFTELEGAGGVWRAAEGQAAIHADHQRTGRHSLRLPGGEDQCVEFEPAIDGRPASELSFWAERWTSRAPFAFRVHGRVNGRWTELYNGDGAIAVGGFNTRVRVALPRGVDRIRLTSTSPENSGVMIDDLRIGEAIPMRVASINTLQPVSPALVGNRTSPVALVVVETVGSLEPITLQELRINTVGTTDLADLDAIEVYFTGDDRELSNRDADANFPESARFGRPARPADQAVFRGRQVLAEGANYFWVSVTVSDDADIDHRIDAGCDSVTLSTVREPVVPETVNPDGAQRMGVAVRNHGDDGVHTYRIPGLATTNQGTLIGVYDIRHTGGGDLPGHIDVGMSRSTDGGRTWEPMQTIMDMGNDDGEGLRGNGIGDPAVLVDTETNTVWVAATWSHGNRSWRGSGPGLTPAETGQLMLVRSDDDGVTWSNPINITAQVKDPAWCFLLQGPGKGITLSDGTILFPAQYQDTPANNRLPRSSIIYSRDHGETWHIGTGAWDDTTEAQVVELEDGVLMINCRYNRQNRRVVRTSTDMGATWEEHPTTRDTLTEPGSCMASLINVDRELERTYAGLLLFSNPASTRARREMTIRASADSGLTWPDEHALLIDHGVSAGYSCLSMIDEHTVGILYEGNRAHMTFQRIPLADLIGTREQPAP